MVVHSLLAYKVALFYLLAIDEKRWQCILLELAAALVLLVVTVALGVVQSHVKVKALGETVVNEQLQVRLCVVVGLSVIVMVGAGAVGEHVSATVVSAAIQLHLLLCGVVPCMVCLLLAAKGNEAYACAVAIICSLQVE